MIHKWMKVWKSIGLTATYTNPPIIRGPIAPTATSGPCEIDTETMVVKNIAGTVDIAPAAAPELVWLRIPLMKILHEAIKPRAR